ncbi:unnamed protein product [Urochloa humidicola]
MARAGEATRLRAQRVVDVEYKRIPCEYAGRNLSIRVEEKSRQPSELSIRFLYQGVQTDIVAVDVATVRSSNWRFMTRDHGPAWSTAQAPATPLQLRLVVTGGLSHCNQVQNASVCAISSGNIYGSEEAYWARTPFRDLTNDNNAGG